MIKVSIIVLLGLAGAAGLRKRSAALRHWVLATSIICAGVMPALEFVLPSWQMPLHASMFGRTVEPLTLFVPLQVAQALQTASVAARDGAASQRPPVASDALRSIWLGGVAVSLSLLLIGLARLAWIASRSYAVRHGTWIEVADELSRDYGLGRPVQLLQSHHPTLLVTWGLRQPKVLLPQGAHTWSVERVRSVLGHELAHIRRRDWLMHMAAALLRSAYWFNPLVWIACRRLRLESEHACDDAVLGLGVEGPAYATHLLDLARAFQQHRAPVLPAPAMARPSSLERRVSAMLNDRLNRNPTTRATCVAVVIALIALALPIASFVASAQTTAATFSGSLIDAVGHALPNTTLSLSNLATNQTHDSTSDQTGSFAFGGLAAGEYQIQVALAGFDRVQGRITLAAGQTLNQDVALQIGELEESVTVSSAAAPRVTKPSAPITPPQYQAGADRCSQSAIGGCIVQPIPLSHTDPVYPPEQRDTGVSGRVKMAGRIGTDGFVKDLRLAAPANPAFVNATVDALRQWQYAATRLDGVPVETNIQVTVNFAIR